MMLTTASTLCSVITDNQASQAVACTVIGPVIGTVIGPVQSHERHSAPALQQSLGVHRAFSPCLAVTSTS